MVELILSNSHANCFVKFWWWFIMKTWICLRSKVMFFTNSTMAMGFITTNNHDLGEDFWFTFSKHQTSTVPHHQEPSPRAHRYFSATSAVHAWRRNGASLMDPHRTAGEAQLWSFPPGPEGPDSHPFIYGFKLSMGWGFTKSLLPGKTGGVLPKHLEGWWFRICFIFTPTWGNDPIWLIFFQMGWFNHQLDLFKTWLFEVPGFQDENILHMTSRIGFGV